jgi:hypothetical protein
MISYRGYIESLWAAGRRRFEDVTAGEMARAVALWCKWQPVDAECLSLDPHVADRIAHRLFEYFDAVAEGESTTAHRAELGISQLWTAAAREAVERDIRRHFQTDQMLAAFLQGIRPSEGVAA